MTDPWHVAESAFPRQGTAAEQLRFLVSYAVLAPSSHNTQPWLFRAVDGALELYADRSRALPVVDPDEAELAVEQRQADRRTLVQRREILGFVPRLLGSLKGSDFMKVALIAAILIGCVLETAGVTSFKHFFDSQ